jgi:hypothetical protein
VPSDLEQMPHLLNFLLNNGTVSGNHYTPLISHTAQDIVTSLTGHRFGVIQSLSPKPNIAAGTREKAMQGRPLDVQTFLNEHPFSGFQWTIFVLCFCIVLLDGFDTAAIGYIAPSLITEWNVERPALAPVLSAALFGLAFGALSAGPMADRFGRKAVLV